MIVATTMPNHPNRSQRGDNPARNPMPAEIRDRREAAGAHTGRRRPSS
jgi:hypothetical protein